MKINYRYILSYSAVIALIMLAAFIFNNKKQMSPVFTIPFFSGAANFIPGREWKYAPEEEKIYKSKSIEEKEGYKFRKFTESHLVNYQHYNIGYLYTILIAKKLFVWAGDVQATKYFQVLIHILISLIIFSNIKDYSAKLFFILGYSLNPLIIYFTTFPFLYFWQVLPAAIFYYMTLKEFRLNIFQFIALGILLGFSFIIRPTGFFIILFILALFFFRTSFKLALTSTVTCVAFVLVFNTKAENKSVWHTIYAGIGAYPNTFVSALSDNEAFAVYEKYTGEKLSISTGGNFYNLKVFKQYEKLLQKEYMQIAQSSPFMLLKNAVLNFFQSFSVGYLVDYPLWISYLSSFIGFIFFTLLLLKRHFLWIAAIALNSISFTPYFPPIPAYMFGGYILIAGAFIQLLGDFGLLRWLDEKMQNLKYFSRFNAA